MFIGWYFATGWNKVRMTQMFTLVWQESHVLHALEGN